jgi:hypothetical protein
MERYSWFKSSYSSPTGQCVECARTQDDGMAVRDSKHPSGVALAFARAAWHTFLRDVRVNAMSHGAVVMT